MNIRPDTYKDRVLEFLGLVKWAAIRDIKAYCYITDTDILTSLLEERLIRKDRVRRIKVYGITEKGYEWITGKKMKIESETPEDIYKLLLRNRVYVEERTENPKLKLLTHNEACDLGLMPVRDEYILYDSEDYYLMLSFVEKVELPKSLNPILDRKTSGGLSYREIVTRLWCLINNESQQSEMERLMTVQPNLSCDLFFLLPTAFDEE